MNYSTHIQNMYRYSKHSASTANNNKKRETYTHQPSHKQASGIFVGWMRRRVRMPDAELEPLLQEESRSCWGNYTIIAHHPSDRVPQAHHRPFVHKGYRLQQSVVSSIPSLFAIHNETVRRGGRLLG